MKTEVPFLDLGQQAQTLKAELQHEFDEILTSTQFVLGPKVAAFEEKFAAYIGVTHAVAVNSGTSALHLALLAAGVGPGDEVITVPFTFIATSASVTYTGATPVFVDVSPETYTMDPALIEQAITDKTRVILPVHIHGQPADMDAIMQIAARNNLTVIEDAAQSHGATVGGATTGAIGKMGCFSFYPGKNLGAYGEGGLVTTNDAELAEQLRVMRDWGQKEKYLHTLPGFNYRMDAFQGAVLRVKMKHIEAWTQRRIQIAAMYDQALAGKIELPGRNRKTRHVFHVYAILHKERDQLQKYLKEKGIHTGIHYPIPVHLQPVYAGLGHQRGAFPVAEQAAEHELSLPIFPEMTDHQVETVLEALLSYPR